MKNYILKTDMTKMILEIFLSKIHTTKIEDLYEDYDKSLHL